MEQSERRREPFNKESMKLSLDRAGLTPRDLRKLMPCHPATLYTFLKTGGGRRLSVFAFEKLKEFLDSAVEQSVFPNGNLSTAKRRVDFVHRAYNHWLFSEKNLENFDP